MLIPRSLPDMSKIERKKIEKERRKMKIDYKIPLDPFIQARINQTFRMILPQYLNDAIREEVNDLRLHFARKGHLEPYQEKWLEKVCQYTRKKGKEAISRPEPDIFRMDEAQVHSNWSHIEFKDEQISGNAYKLLKDD